MRISSPPVTHPCFYGIDTSDRTKLIAADRSIPGIQRLIGADTLGYLTEEQLLSAFGVTDMRHHSFCNACFTGRYPTPLYDSMEKDVLEKSRTLVLR
jgi:amidophosphoribosyltransferase